jgi:hypothetical protein
MEECHKIKVLYIKILDTGMTITTILTKLTFKREELEEAVTAAHIKLIKRILTINCSKHKMHLNHWELIVKTSITQNNLSINQIKIL